MRAWIVAAIIVLIIFLISRIRVGVLVKLEEKVSVLLRIGPFHLDLTAKPKKAKKPKKPKKAKKKGSGTSFPKPTFAEIRELIDIVLQVLAYLGRRVKRNTRITPLNLTVVFGGDDPAEVAKLYGYANAALYAVVPPLDGVLIYDPEIHLRMDFAAESTTVRGKAGISLIVADALTTVCFALPRLLRWLLRYYRAHRSEKNTATPPTTPPSQTAAA